MLPHQNQSRLLNWAITEIHFRPICLHENWKNKAKD